MLNLTVNSSRLMRGIMKIILEGRGHKVIEALARPNGSAKIFVS